MNEKILERAIMVYGEDRQKRKTVEEIGEYLQAVNKLDEAILKDNLEQCKYEKQHLQEEIADCLIMFHQMRLIYGPKEVDTFILEKLCRLEMRIDEASM